MESRRQDAAANQIELPKSTNLSNKSNTKFIQISAANLAQNTESANKQQYLRKIYSKSANLQNLRQIYRQ